MRRKGNERFRSCFQKFPIICTIVVSWIGALIYVLYFFFFSMFGAFNLDDSGILLLTIGIIAIFIIYPGILTFYNFVSLIHIPKDKYWVQKGKIIECITIVLGVVYSFLAFNCLLKIQLFEDWEKVLENSDLHTPIWTHSYLTILVLVFLGFVGYLILSTINLLKLSPLIIVISMAMMYMGVAVNVMWIIQVAFMHDVSWVVCVFPFNCIVIAAKTIRYKIHEWKAMDIEVSEGKGIIAKIDRLFWKATYWPLIAFIIMWPLLGIIFAILILFGQKPDNVIKAWTETSEWRLSEKISPPNVQVDEHYLCTVAANGHRKLVKPIRMGERHGHRVVVNRQLCIANAFEQILEERTPRLHKHIRHFYDTYGFPIAKHIRTRLAADVVYVIMKPLEWIFLFVLYLVDTKPENRIAIQYMPKN